jgi:aminopeptidase-like protein
MNQIELEDIVSQIDHIGLDMYQLMTELFPICRSITGNGVRDTLNKIKNHIDLKIHEIPSNTSVFSEKFQEFFKEKSIQLEKPNDWRGNFMASAFVAEATIN